MNLRELEELYVSISNWNRWGPDDELGTLNLITPEVRKRGFAAIRSGEVVSCSASIGRTGELKRNPVCHILIGGDVAPEDGCGQTTDYIGIATHGPTFTHLDALCHMNENGLMYNGRPASMVSSIGAQANAISAIHEGIVSRGILLDIPKFRDAPYVPPGEAIRRSELEAVESAQGVRVEEGDVVLLRVGRGPAEDILGIQIEPSGVTRMAGLHADCLPWLKDRGVSLLVADSASDALPSQIEGAPVPIHVGTIVHMGLHLLDNADLEGLSKACAARNHYDVLLTVAPLRIEGGTGSPVNPLAIL